jgi:hypothetical protein
MPLDEVDADFSGMWRYNNGNLELISGGVFQYKDVLVHDDTYVLNAGTQVIGPFTLPDYPGDGAIAVLHARVWAVTNASGDLFEFEMKLEGQDILIFGANEQYNQSSPTVPFPGHNDNCIPVATVDDSVSGQLQQINASVAGSAEIKIWLKGYYT